MVAITAGQYIKARRLALGLRQLDLAAAMGTGRKTIYEWENDIYRPRYRRCLELAWVLQVNPIEVVRRYFPNSELLRFLYRLQAAARI